MNQGMCNTCRALVPAAPTERDGKVFLAKDCPECGKTETLIASDAERYRNKHRLDGGFDRGVCKLNCLDCRHKKPNIVFLDITNRCNMNCPICINNTPTMGFLFEPPFEYFVKIFKHFSRYDPKPSFQLFGGEPTVREDLLDIVKTARGYGFPTRVVTNGIKLADEEYCRALVENRATILIAYDGANPEVYRVLRGNGKFLELKERAIENIRKFSRAKVVLMSLVAKGFNDRTLSELFHYVHERRDVIRGIYFMPLAHTWDKKEFDLEPERITCEDVESSVDDAFPGDRVDFIPAGFIGQLPNVMKHLRLPPLPFAGAHPNCESMYLLVSDGQEYVPVGRYFKDSVLDVCSALLAAERRLARRAEGLEKGVFGRALAAIRLKRLYLRLCAGLSVGWTLLRHARVRRFFRGRGPAKLYHMLALPLGMATGTRTKEALTRHSTVQNVLQLIVLPFEDKSTLETDRMERCPSGFAFYDPRKDRVEIVPACAWGLHKSRAMQAISEYYKTQMPQATVQAG